MEWTEASPTVLSSLTKYREGEVFGLASDVNLREIQIGEGDNSIEIAAWDGATMNQVKGPRTPTS